MKTATPFIKPLFITFFWLLIAIGFSSCTSEKKEEQGEAKIECVVYFCRENDVCLLQRVRFEIPFGAQTLTNDDDGELLTQGVTNLRFDVPANDPVPPVNAAAIPTFD